MELLMNIMKDRIQELENTLKERDEKLNTTSGQNKMAVKVIQGLQSKNDEVNEKLKEVQGEADRLREDVHKLNVEKHEVEGRGRDELAVRDDKISQLTQTVHDHEQRLENLMRSLGKKDGELGNFRQLLAQAQDALRQSEVAVEILQDELMKEKRQAEEGVEKQAAHYKNLLSDVETQVKNKDVLLQQMTDRLDAKDRQLQDCMDFIQADKKDKNSTLDNLLKKMEERLKKKDEEIEYLGNENDEKNEIIKELNKKLQAFQRALKFQPGQHGDVPDDILHDMNRLKRELAQLREQQNNKPVYGDSAANMVPELFKLLEEQLKEMHYLSESLKQEHQIFITLNARGEDGDKSGVPADRAATFHTELGAVQSLREQLQDTVLRNNSLWQQLHHHVNTSAAATHGDTHLDEDFVRPNRNQSPGVFNKAVATSPRRHRDSDNGKYISSRTSPVARTRSEIHTQTSPVGWTQSEIHKQKLPVGHTRSEIHTQTSPVGHTKSEIHTQTSPVGHTWSEIHTETSPVGHTRSEIHIQTSPLDRTRSDIDTQTSPRIQLYTSSEASLSQSGRGHDGPSHRRDQSGMVPQDSPAHQRDRPLLEPHPGFFNVAETFVLEHRESAILDTEAIAGMTSTMLRKLVSQLQDDLLSALKQNHQLQQHVLSTHVEAGNIPGNREHHELSMHVETDVTRDREHHMHTGDIPENGNPSVMDLHHLKEEVSELRRFLDGKVEENHVLREHLALDPDKQLDYAALLSVHDLQNELVKVHSQLNDVLSLNESLKKQINTITMDSYTSGLNAETMVDLAGGIEILRSRPGESGDTVCREEGLGLHREAVMQDASVQASPSVFSIPRLRLTHSCDEVDTTLQSSDDTVSSQSVKPSRIPRLRGQSSDTTAHPVTSLLSHEHHPLIVERRLHDQLNQLTAKLAATEETVHYQTQKMKHYRKLLQEAGLGLLDSRSQSELCLNKSAPKSFHASFECLYPSKPGDKSGVSMTASGSGLTNSLSPPRDFSIKRTFSHDNIAEACCTPEDGVRQKIKNLEEQLELSKYENLELQEKLNEFQQSASVRSKERENVEVMSLERKNALERGNIELTSQEREHFELMSQEREAAELTSLRNELVDSEKANAMLRQQLEEVNTFLSEIVQLNSDEDDRHLSGTNSIQEYLDQSVDFLQHAASHSFTSALHDKYCKALQQIHQLKDQQRHNQQQPKKEGEQTTKAGRGEGASLALTRQVGYKGQMGSDTDSLRSTSPSDGRPKQSSVGNHHSLTLTRAVAARENRSAESDIIMVYKQTDENYGRPVTSLIADCSMEQMRHRAVSGNSTVESRHLTSSLSALDNMRQRYNSGLLDGGHSPSSRYIVHSEKDSVLSVSNHISTNGDSDSAVLPGMAVLGNTNGSVLGGDSSRLYSSHYNSKFDFSQLYDTTLNALDKRHDDAGDVADSVGSRSLTDLLSDVSSSQTRLSEVKDPQSNSQEMVRQLKSRLRAVDNMNRTLRDELSIYETLCTSAGLDKSCGAVVPSGNSTGNDTLNLKEHLAEIRALRLKLEKSLLDNEKLNEQLMMQQQSVVVHYECELRLRKLQEIIAGLQGELSRKDGSCSAYHSQCEIKLSDLQDTIDRLHTERMERENAVKQRENEVSQRENEVRLWEDNVRPRDNVYSQRENVYSQREKLYSQRENAVRQRENEVSQMKNVYSQREKKQEDRIRELEDSLKTLHNELSERDTLSSVNQKQEVRIHELEDSLKTLHNALSDRDMLSSVNQKQEVRIRELEDSLKSLRSELSERDTLSSVNQKQEVRIRELEDSLKTLHNALSDRDMLSSVNQKQEVRIRELEDSLKSLRSELSERDTLSRVNQKQYEATISELQGCVKTLQEELVRKDEAVNVFKKQTDSKLSEQQTCIRSLQSELAQREKVITEKHTLITEKEKIIRESTVCLERHERERSEKASEVASREKLVRDLEQKCHKLELHLKKATKEIKRLQADTHGLVEQVAEKSKLNKSLKLELSVHERLQTTSTSEDDNKSLIRELLTELRHLRVQLEKAIDTNNNLRRTVESLLKQQADQNRMGSTRNDSPTGSLTTDATDGRPSPDPHHSQSRKQSRRETHTTLSTTSEHQSEVLPRNRILSVTSEHRSETSPSNHIISDDGAVSDVSECASSDIARHYSISHHQPATTLPLTASQKQAL
ncbi:interaptin-like [Gigantopelta aegis]|uniref:interaptin-like n=1 Tax=Gigantopelta aegis TaxID=1735272 RepID=UPI001B88B589|nr:interaptin-like [Gigantopelta aegis]